LTVVTPSSWSRRSSRAIISGEKSIASTVNPALAAVSASVPGPQAMSASSEPGGGAASRSASWAKYRKVGRTSASYAEATRSQGIGVARGDGEVIEARGPLPRGYSKNSDGGYESLSHKSLILRRST